MPHIVMEYSAELASSFDIPEVLRACHASVCSDDSVDPMRVKSRALALYDTCIADDEMPRHMVHIQLKLFPGRSDDTRMNIAEGLRDTLLEQLKRTPGYVAVSVETSLLHAESYVVDQHQGKDA